MVGSRKLSNDEVEALLSGLDEESNEETAQQFDPTEVREFKFGTEDLSLLGDYYALRMINEKICRFTDLFFYRCFVSCQEYLLFLRRLNRLMSM